MPGISSTVLSLKAFSKIKIETEKVDNKYKSQLEDNKSTIDDLKKQKEQLLVEINDKIAELEKELEIVKVFNENNAKVHVTVNIVPEDKDFETLDEYLMYDNKKGWFDAI